MRCVNTFLDLLDAAGLPLPIVQRRIAHRGHFAARVDTLYPHLALVIELDGHAHHSSREDRVRDERRRRRLVLLGHRVMVFTYDDLVDEPDEVVADVMAALGAEAAA